MLYFAISVFIFGVFASFVWVSNLDRPLDQSLAIWAVASVIFGLISIGIAI